MTRIPEATVQQVARELGINANMLGRWRRVVRQHGEKAFPGQGHARDEELMQLKRELAKVRKERDFLKEAAAFFGSVEMKFRMIDRCRGASSVQMMCRHLDVSSSGYYEWRTRPLSARGEANRRLLGRIKVLHEASDGVLGRRRICDDLRDEGERVSVNRVGWLMRGAELRGIPQRRRWRGKPGRPRPAAVINHLQRDFAASDPNTKWATDINYSAPSLGRRQDDAARA